MVTRAEYEFLLGKIERLSKEMEDIRQVLLESKPQDDGESEKAWENLMSLWEEVSAKWQGPSAVEEVRAQRSKGY